MSKPKENIAKHYLANKKRVKLYSLAKQGAWSDLATGFAFIKKEPPFYLTMIDEITKSIVFKLPLTSRAVFHLQHNTIISWKESSEMQNDSFALSFSDAQGVQEIWMMIALLKGDDATELKENSDDVLPEVSLSNLPLIAKEIQPSTEKDKLQKILFQLKKSNCLFIFQIGKLFDEEERKLNEEKLSHCSNETSSPNSFSDMWTSTSTSTSTSLSMGSGSLDEKKGLSLSLSSSPSHLSFIYSIIKNIILIADLDLLEKLMNEHICPIIFGALEYDLDSSKTMKHRQFLSEVANFNNILLLQDDVILKKIQMNYLLIYLRDNVIARFLDRFSVVIINRLIQMNNIDIIQFFIGNKQYLEQVVMHWVSNDIAIQYKATLFITEFINSSKDLFLYLAHYQELLCQCGFIKAIECLLIKRQFELQMRKQIESQMSNETIALKDIIFCKLIEILAVLISILPNVIKDHMMNKMNCDKEGRSVLLMTLTSLIQIEPDFGIKAELGMMVNKLVDVVLSQGQGQEDCNIRHPIFINCLNLLGYFLLINSNDNNKVYYGDKKTMTQSKEIIIEMFSLCLNQANKNSCMPYWFIDSDIITKVLYALKDQSKSLTISIVKFIKKMIESGNEYYIQGVIHFGCLNVIVDLFNRNKSKDNLIFSSLMSLFDYVIKDYYNSQSLISIYQNQKFHETIYSIENQKYFQPLITKYESMPHSSSEVLFPQSKEPIDHFAHTGIQSSLGNETMFDDDDFSFMHKSDSNHQTKSNDNDNDITIISTPKFSMDFKASHCNHFSAIKTEDSETEAETEKELSVIPTFLHKKRYTSPL